MLATIANIIVPVLLLGLLLATDRLDRVLDRRARVDGAPE